MAWQTPSIPPTEKAGAIAAALAGTPSPACPAGACARCAGAGAPLTRAMAGADVCRSTKPGAAATPESLLLRTCLASDFFSSVMCCCCCREEASASDRAVYNSENKSAGVSGVCSVVCAPCGWPPSSTGVVPPALVAGSPLRPSAYQARPAPHSGASRRVCATPRATHARPRGPPLLH